MLYLIALGNPGDEYTDTRHNVGWYMADKIRQSQGFSDLVFSAKYQGYFCKGLIGGNKVTLLYPDTFMNHSGVAVAKLVPAKEYHNIIVLHDDVALPLGQLKISTGRGAGGHNGLESIISTLGTKGFTRIRIGIAPTSFLTGKVKPITGEKMAKFVLGRFSGREITILEELSLKVYEALRVLVVSGVATAMNRYNTR